MKSKTKKGSHSTPKAGGKKSDWRNKIQKLGEMRHVTEYNELPALASQVAVVGLGEADRNQELAETIKLRAACEVAAILFGKRRGE